MEHRVHSLRKVPPPWGPLKHQHLSNSLLLRDHRFAKKIHDFTLKTFPTTTSSSLSSSSSSSVSSLSIDAVTTLLQRSRILCVITVSIDELRACFLYPLLTFRVYFSCDQKQACANQRTVSGWMWKQFGVHLKKLLFENATTVIDAENMNAVIDWLVLQHNTAGGERNVYTKLRSWLVYYCNPSKKRKRNNNFATTISEMSVKSIIDTILCSCQSEIYQKLPWGMRPKDRESLFVNASDGSDGSSNSHERTVIKKRKLSNKPNVSEALDVFQGILTGSIELDSEKRWLAVS